MVVRRIVSIFIFASSIRSLIRNPKVGIAFGLMAKISEDSIECWIAWGAAQLYCMLQ